VRIIAQRNMVSSEIDIWFVQERGRGPGLVAAHVGELQWVRIEEGHVRPEATLHLPEMCGKPLLDALNGLDIKTDKDAMLAGTVEALRAHLADMRALAMRQLPVTLRNADGSRKT